MSRIVLALRVLVRVLFHPEVEAEARRLVDLSETAAPASGLRRDQPSRITPALSIPVPPQAETTRSDALNLLAVLQREARLIDFLQEDISGYSDAQVGAAVRDVHRGSAAALQRLLGPKPVLSEPEGASVTVAGGADTGRVRLTGNVTGQPPYRGALRHAGWEATKVELPAWTGTSAAARVIAPAEIEVGAT